MSKTYIIKINLKYLPIKFKKKNIILFYFYQLFYKNLKNLNIHKFKRIKISFINLSAHTAVVRTLKNLNLHWEVKEN